MKLTKCCICGKEFTGHGNNPAPVENFGKCCNDCHFNLVVPRRMLDAKKAAARAAADAISSTAKVMYRTSRRVLLRVNIATRVGGNVCRYLHTNAKTSRRHRPYFICATARTRIARKQIACIRAATASTRQISNTPSTSKKYIPTDSGEKLTFFENENCFVGNITPASDAAQPVIIGVDLAKGADHTAPAPETSDKGGGK